MSKNLKQTTVSFTERQMKLLYEEKNRTGNSISTILRYALEKYLDIYGRDENL